MSNTSGLSLEQLKAKRAELEAQGKSLSTSKEMGKIENAIKVLNPSNYGANQVSSAQEALRSSTQPGAMGMAGIGGLSALEKQLAEKQKAIATATSNINDNPWYSEATRVGKLARLQEQSQMEIANLNNQIAQQRADQQNAQAQSNWERTFAQNQMQENKPMIHTYTDAGGNLIEAVINPMTGAIITQNRMGKTSTPGAGKSPEQLAAEKTAAQFDADLKWGMEQLQKGAEWGVVWNQIYSKYQGTEDDAALKQAIEAGLGGSGTGVTATGWAQGGAFENYYAKSHPSTSPFKLDANGNVIPD